MSTSQPQKREAMELPKVAGFFLWGMSAQVFKSIPCIVVEVFQYQTKRPSLHSCCCCEDKMILHKSQLPKIGICGTSLDFNGDLFVKMFPQKINVQRSLLQMCS